MARRGARHQQVLAGAIAAATVCAASVLAAPQAGAVAGRGVTAGGELPPPTTPLGRIRAESIGVVPRRVFDATVAWPCNKARLVWIGDVAHELANLGGGPRLDDVQMVRALRTGGFTWDEMVVALAVAAAESDRCPKATHNNFDPTTGALRSVDVGLWQINVTYHREYAGWNLKDPVVASTAAKRIQVAAHGWGPWHGYVNKDLYLDWATQAAAEAKAAGVR